jgi:N-acetyl-gamma-glutamyl-phosphate reductase
MIRAGLVGVTGYTGMELARLLAVHPHMRLAAATSRAEAGKPLKDLYPFLVGFPGAELTLSDPDPASLSKECDLVFLAIPHGTAMEMAAGFLARGCRVVDLSADFRLHDAEVYAAWYGKEHSQPGLLAEAVYGLPELHAEKIRTARLVANPGCYPTAAIIGLHAPLKLGLIETDGIVIDAKSGASGAGRAASTGTLFCEISDTFKAYNLAQHRHTPEIEQELSACANLPMTVSFNPHLLPINRGILTTIYTRLRKSATYEEIADIVAAAWRHAPFVRLLPKGTLPETRFVRGSMFCDMGLVVDKRTQRLIIVTAIDNLCRGASGQAIANANLMFGLDAFAGLNTPPLLP